MVRFTGKANCENPRVPPPRGGNSPSSSFCIKDEGKQLLLFLPEMLRGHGWAVVSTENQKWSKPQNKKPLHKPDRNKKT